MNMTEHIAPVPPECDLRGLPWMPIDTVRLLDSDLFALATGEEFKAAVSLWCKAWQQVPASSLPDNDQILAKLSGAGGRWKKVKDQALRGFVKCTDGRLYHPVIAEKALEAWAHRTAQRSRAAKRWHPSGNAAAHATAYPTAMQGTGTVQGHDKTKNSKPFAPSAAHSPPKVNGHRIVFNEETKRFEGITEEDELRWQEAYPAVPIPPEIVKAAAWIAENPANRKSNYGRYLVNWFSRAQDRAVRVRPQQTGRR